MNIYIETALEPADGRKSFYNKAHLIETDNHFKLRSYTTMVAEYEKSNKELTIYGYYSPTTARHINSFLRFLGLPSMNKKQILSVVSNPF